MTTPYKGLSESILGRLPKELSNKVYDHVMDVDFTSKDKHHRLQGTTHTPQEEEPLTLRQKLAPLQVCREMRAEAIGYFFQKPVWLMHQKRTPSEYHTTMAVPADDELKIWSAMIARIPMHLHSRWLTFQYYYECELSIFSEWNPTPRESGPEFEAGIRALVKAARPHKMVVAIKVFFHRMGAFGTSGMGHTLPVCVRDELMTVAECESILVKIPTSDAVKAYRMFQDAFAEKRRRLEKHRSHRVCFIRLSLQKSLERLEIAERKIRELMENIPGFPKPS
ncbi:hypothetical protein MBLNU13_g02661t1 [Cladosporium sp. NU13]